MKNLDHIDTISHPLVDVRISWKAGTGKPFVTGISLHRPGTLDVQTQQNCGAPIVTCVERYLDGYPVDLCGILVAMPAYTVFQSAVLRAARSIPRGSTCTYAELAALAGRPAAARTAASVMRNNPFPLVIPCHRVIAAGDRIGGFMGKSSGWEIELKRQLLAMEGQ